MYTWKITEVKQYFRSDRWYIKIDDILTYSSKEKPPYKVGDIIVSLQHCIHWMDTH